MRISSIHKVPKRAFRDPTVIGNVTFPQLIVLVTGGSVLIVPFAVSISIFTTVLALVGIIFLIAMYMLFSMYNDEPVKVFGQNAKFIAERLIGADRDVYTGVKKEDKA